MKKSKKLLSLVLAVLLCVGMLPMSVLTVSATGHSHCVCGGNTNIGDHTTHTNISFDEWNSTDSMPDTTGNYVLMNDVTITSQWKPANNIVLCLNGFDLLFESSIRQSTIQLEGIENFTLCDCKGTGKVSHTNGTFGRGVNIYEGVFSMYGGNISDNNVNDSGGGVNVGGTFKMYGGSISNNETEVNGGGIYVFGDCTIYGGIISSNASAENGGGVAVYGEDGVKGTFTMLGGVIKNNTSASYGGGVSVGRERRFNADITVGGTAVIKDNTVGTNPNNLHLHYSTTGNEQQLVTVSDMSADAEIGISMDTDKEGVFSNGGKDYAANFFSDNGAYAVAADGENLKLVEAKPVQVGQVNLYDGEYTTDGETKTADTPTGTGYAYYTGGVLKLNNFEYKGAGSVDSADDDAKESIIYTTNNLKIEVIGENTFNLDRENEFVSAIYVKADLEIYGGGVLNIESDSTCEYITGIRGLGAVTHTIKDITLNISLNQNGSQGIHNQITGNRLIIDNAVINIDTMNHCFQVGHIQAANSIMSLTSVNKHCLRVFRGLDLNNCYVNAKGVAVIAVNSDTNYAINIGSGHYIFDGSHEFSGAIYRGDTDLNLTDSYYYRTDKAAVFTDNSTPFEHNNNEKYIEIYTEGWSIPARIEWSADTSFTYDGTEKVVTATVKNKISANDDVELVLSGNKGTNANTYTATVMGITGADAAKYTLVGGQNLTKNWEITKATPSYTVPTGLTATYGQTLADVVLTTGFTWQDAGTTSVGNAGTQIFKAAFTPTDTANYETVADIDVAIEVGKATPTYTAPTGLTATYGQTLANVTLPAGFTWQDAGTTSVGNEGTNTFKATFTPTDTANYEIITDIEVTVYVTRRSSGSSSVTRYTVRFDTNGGSDVKAVTVTWNNKAVEPAEPIRDGFVFDGWYTDKGLSEKYDFNTRVIKNYTLYAKWVEEEKEPVEPAEWENPFTDVDKTDWYYETVKTVYEQGLMNGVTDTLFAPNDSITRGMFVTILYRAESEPAVNKSMPFADVKANDYYANAVIWAQQNGIVNGVSENEFAPNSNITREQMAAILYRYAQFKEYDVSVGEDTNILSYTDFDKISEYAFLSIQWACGEGIISGRGNGVLNPTGFATRCEAAAMLTRLLDIIG